MTILSKGKHHLSLSPVADCKCFLFYVLVIFWKQDRTLTISCHIINEDRYGAESRALPRPILYDLFLRNVPKERVHFGKKIHSTQQDDNGVTLTCVDGSEYKGDILVGADGAYSAVRQNLYTQLMKENKLPASDGLPLPFVNVCLVGQTRQLTLEEFPDLAKPECQFKNIVSKDKPYAVSRSPEGLHCNKCIIISFPYFST